MYSNRNRANMGSTNIRDNYYNNGPVPTNFTENSKEKCLFDSNQNNFSNITQSNEVEFDNFDNRGKYYLKQSFKNKGLLHNNLGENITNEYIDERDIIIDTVDRNIVTYPNIFNFTLKLGATETTPGPYIHRSINNVKYVKLVRVVFPDNYLIRKATHSITDLSTCIQSFIQSKFSELNSGTTMYDQLYTNGTESIYIIHHYVSDSKFYIDFFREVNSLPNYDIVYQAVVDSETLTGSSTVSENFAYSFYQDTQIEKGRYYQLHVDQMPHNNDLSTGNSVSKSYSLLFPGREDSRGFNILNAMETDKIFKFSNLGNFSSLKIEIRDSTGELLEIDSSIWNTNLIASEKINKKIINVNSTTSDNYKHSFRSPDKYIRHQLCSKMQALFIFTIGEVSMEMNKKTFN